MVRAKCLCSELKIFKLKQTVMTTVLFLFSTLSSKIMVICRLNEVLGTLAFGRHHMFILCGDTNNNGCL